MEGDQGRKTALRDRDEGPLAVRHCRNRENWKSSDGEWGVCPFTPANELVGTIDDRMPAVLAPADYDRWVGAEPDPRDLLRPFPSDLMVI